MKKIVVANLKMNQTYDQSKDYLINFLSKYNNPDIQMVLCLPFTSLSLGKFLIGDRDIKIGAQNVSDEQGNNQTGEVSARMLRNVGVEYVIVGHTERREKFKESNILINNKIKSALKEGMKCILCIGESASERLAGKVDEIIRQQVTECIKGLYENELESIIISYEPAWAVSTGKNATGKEIENACKIIKSVILETYSEKAANEIVIVYGGSLNSTNALKILENKDLRGELFGMASFDVDSFVSVLNKIK